MGFDTRFIFVVGALLFALVVSGSLSNAADEAAQARFFHEQVEPILVGHCLECHGVDPKSGLDLRTRLTALEGGESGPSLEPGDPETSLLFDYVSREEMPPEKPLTADQIASLRQWIADGVYYPDQPLDPFTFTTDRRAGFDWWSLQPLTNPEPPSPAGLPDAWGNNTIDRFVFAKLVEKGLAPSSPTSSRTLIRRATYDLTGLPPTPEEVGTFLAECQNETGNADQVGERAYVQLVDRLLASPRYGEHWGRHWLDVIRFGESRGFERNEIIDNAWPFRDYVIRSLNEDKPFDQLAREHLAGDVIGSGNLAVEVGVAFLVCGPYDDVKNKDPIQAKQSRANTVDEIVRATSETFLGLTVGCARCHDHKFDPISQKDYYRLYATFAGIFHGGRVVAPDEKKQADTAKRQPLNTALVELQEKSDSISDAAFARAEPKAAEYATAWTRPAIDRQETVETFAPVETQTIRLVCEGTDVDPAKNTGYQLEEFEIWTSGKAPQNVALATHGAQAEGRLLLRNGADISQISQEDADALGVALIIDGKDGIRWLSGSPEVTITLAKPEKIDRVVFYSDHAGVAGEQSRVSFPCEYRIEISSDGRHWTEVANSKDRKPWSDAHRRQRLIDLELTSDEQQQLIETTDEIARVSAELAALPQLETWWLGNPEQQAGPFHIFLGGNPQRLGDAVLPASLTALAKTLSSYQLDDDSAEGVRRQVLADWLIDRKNPITPRVLANRVWHYHFGTGIVDTPSDFGFMGGRPTHPELLDWLANQVHTSGWRLKPVHRLLMLSQTYRQSGDFRATEASLDGQARYLWRYPPRRLSAEEIRDTMLAVAGQLNPAMGGPGFRLYGYTVNNVAKYAPLAKHGLETYRRSVYHQNARAVRVDLMTEYDAPDCALSDPRRTSTTTPLQALTMMNHSFAIDMTNALATRITQGSPNDPIRAIQRAFLLAFSRPCGDEELLAVEQFVAEHGLQAFCRALFNANEFIYIN
jgi:cytochrome c553